MTQASTLPCEATHKERLRITANSLSVMDAVHPWNYKVVISYIDRFKFATTCSILEHIFHKLFYVYKLLSWKSFIWKTIKYNLSYLLALVCPFKWYNMFYYIMICIALSPTHDYVLESLGFLFVLILSPPVPAIV